jgi:hypothetical protein
MQVTVKECLAGEGIRGPELDTRAVLADPPDLAKDVIRLLDVLEKVRRKDGVDGPVLERIAVLGQVEDVVDLGPVDVVEPYEPLFLGAAATEIDVDT